MTGAMNAVRAAAVAASAGLVGCAANGADPWPATLLAEGDSMSTVIGTVDGQDVREFALTNRNGTRATLMTYGATLTSLFVPDRDGVLGDVVLGFDDLESYRTLSPYFGCTTGRVANRIAHGKFTLDGTEYQLATNNDPHHLHGGTKGLDKVVWSGEEVQSGEARGVRFSYDSPDGEEGYPGTLSMVVTYWLSDDDALRIEYAATTDQATPVNLTHHSYFNLAGVNGGVGPISTIRDHELLLNARSITASGDDLIPTGELAAVEGTPFDFRRAKRIGAELDAVDGGYDANFVIDREDDTSLVHAATLRDPGTGRVMEIHTTEPGIQFYTGNFLDGSFAGKGGRTYPQHSACCLETQHYPDSINQPSFPSVVLRPGEAYWHVIEHRFGVDEAP